MRKLIFFFIILLCYTTQNNAVHNPPKQCVHAENFHITQQVFEPSEDSPIIVSINSKSTENFIEKIIEKIDERTEDLLDNGLGQFNDIIKESIVPQLKKTWQLTIGSLLNSENAIRFGWPIALLSIVGVSGLYGAHICWKLIEKKILHPRPTILQPGSKYGWIDRWKRSRANYITPPMIFDESVKERLEEIQEKTINVREHIFNGKKVTYDNLLLYGKPGTGKTFFAQILADKTDMDFLSVTAASLLQSGIEGIKYFDEIVAMANNSKYGVILFIDEADALFINRNLLNPESDHYKLLNHILSAIGNGSSTMMIIAATNHAHIMDPAMGRRFQDRIKMPLPNEKTRKDLLNLYINQYLLDEAGSDFDSLAVRKIFTQTYIDTIAKQTAGLSHAEIKDMIMIISKKANASKEGIVTIKHVQSAIDEAIEKIEALKRDKIKMKKKRTSSQENNQQN
jgi:ATPase family AAA domain-containing protein 3A/B